MRSVRVRSRVAGGAPLRRRALFFGAAAAALAVAVYLGALGGPFLFDDGHSVVHNPSIRDLGNLHWILIGSRRVLSNFSFAVDWALWDGRPFGFHLTNLLLHALCVVALFVLARRLLRSDAGALFTASLFAVHPLLTESVAYVSSRAGLLCGLFLLVSTWAWHRALTGRRAWIALAVAAWVLAAASKETGLLAPLLWLACDLLFVDGSAGPRLRRYLPFGIVALALAVLRLASYFRLEGGHGAHRFTLQLLEQAGVLWRYVFLWLAPVGLSAVHPVAPVRHLYDPLSWLSVASIGVALAMLWSARRRAPAIAFGGVWFLILILPSSLVPLMQPMAEHRVYEACAGIALMCGAAVEPLFRRHRAAVLVLAGIVVVLGAATLARVRVWHSALALWQDAANKAPLDPMAHYALGDALRDEGQCERAIEEYTHAVALRPDDLRPRRNRAICQAQLGRFDEAAAELQAELRAAPRDAAAHYNLGVLEAQRHDLQRARAQLQAAAALDPDYALPCEELTRLFPSDPLPAGCAERMR